MVAFLSAMHFKKTCILKGKKLRCTQRPCISSFWDSGGGLLKNVHIHGQSKNRQNSAHVVLNAPQGVIQDFSINKPAWGIARFLRFFKRLENWKTTVGYLMYLCVGLTMFIKNYMYYIILYSGVHQCSRKKLLSDVPKKIRLSKVPILYFITYRRSSIRSRPLIQVYSIRGRT